MTDIGPPDVSRQGARWLAGIGVALLTVAAISLAAAQWEQFGPGSRLTILVVASAVVFAATHALRRIASETARALDVLVATLIPIDVAALVIVSGGTWRAALMAAGPGAVISSETLRRRDRIFVTEVGTAAGGVLTMCGLAALYDVSAPVLLSGLALLAVVVAPGGRDRWFGMIWALLAGLTPALRVLDDAVFTGMGTLREVGLLDAAEFWETVTIGAVATTALVFAAVVPRRPFVALGAVATAAATGLQIWGELDPPSTAGLIAAAVVLVMVELALALPAARQKESASSLVGDVNAAVAGMLTVIVAAVAWTRLTGGEMSGPHYQYTAAVLAVFWLVGDLRRATKSGERGLDLYLVGGRWDPSLPGFAVAIASMVYLGTEQESVLGVVLAALGLVAVTTLRPAHLATAGVAFAAAPFVNGSDAWTTGVAAIATLGVAYVASLLARRPDLAAAGFVGAIAIVTVIPGAMAAAEWDVAAAGLYWLTVLWFAARLVDPRLPVLGSVYRIAAELGLIMVAIDDFALAAGCAAAAAGVQALEYRERATDVHRVLAGVSAMLAWLFANAAAGVDVVEVYVLPPLWLLSLVLVRLGFERSLAIGWAGTYTVLLTVIGRVGDGRPVHTLILGVSALALAVWGAAVGERFALAIGGALAVATAAFEGLDQSMGVETWGWLVIGGTAAVTAATLLEVHDRGGTTMGDAAGADDAFVS